MCGRFTLIRLADFLDRFPWIAPPLSPGIPRYNIAPSQMIAAVTKLERRIDFLRWGLIPAWAADPSIGNRMINARAETLSRKSAFSKLLQTQRCLIPADGFYEWKLDPDGKTKQPMYIRMKHSTPFAFAGLWDTWRKRDDPDAKEVKTCTIITVRPNELVEPIHNRMPAIIAEGHYQGWLSGELPASDVLGSYPAVEMEAFAVSSALNNPRLDVPSVIEPVTSRQGDLFGEWS